MTIIEVSHPEVKTFYKEVAERVALDTIVNLRERGFTARIVSEKKEG